MPESKINIEKEQQEAGSKRIATVAGLVPMILLPRHKCTGISGGYEQKGERRVSGWLAGCGNIRSIEAQQNRSYNLEPGAQV